MELDASYPDNVLPLTGVAWPTDSDKTVCEAVSELSMRTKLRSRFVAVAGKGDAGSDFKSMGEFCRTLRRGLFLDPMLLPAFEVNTAPVNAYLLDYWRNPNLGTKVMLGLLASIYPGAFTQEIMYIVFCRIFRITKK